MQKGGGGGTSERASDGDEEQRRRRRAAAAHLLHSELLAGLSGDERLQPATQNTTDVTIKHRSRTGTRNINIEFI